jgi:hypothetical protein
MVESSILIGDFGDKKSSKKNPVTIFYEKNHVCYDLCIYRHNYIFRGDFGDKFFIELFLSPKSPFALFALFSLVLFFMVTKIFDLHIFIKSFMITVHVKVNIMPFLPFFH